MFKSIRNHINNRNYLMGNFENPVWLIGDGRSGTTWVSSIIDYDGKHKNVFEPFHPHFGPTLDTLIPHQYVRPDDNFQLEDLADRIFRGEYISSRSEPAQTQWRYNGLLIKDIFANLFARWAYEKYPELRIVFLMRNPFAVALSKQKKEGWYWMTDPKDFLKQEDLMADFLEPYREIISDVGDDYIERQIMIWSILNFVPLSQFSRNQIYVLFYENLFEDPETEIGNLFQFLHGPEGADHVSAAMSGIKELSFVAGPESMLSQGKSPVSGWLDEISDAQKASGYEILKHFKLDKIYQKDGRVAPDALQTLPFLE